MDLKHRGLALAPKLAVGDGALGFGAALRNVRARQIASPLPTTTDKFITAGDVPDKRVDSVSIDKGVSNHPPTLSILNRGQSFYIVSSYCHRSFPA